MTVTKDLKPGMRARLDKDSPYQAVAHREVLGLAYRVVFTDGSSVVVEDKVAWDVEPANHQRASIDPEPQRIDYRTPKSTDEVEGLDGEMLAVATDAEPEIGADVVVASVDGDIFVGTVADFDETRGEVYIDLV